MSTDDTLHSGLPAHSDVQYNLPEDVLLAVNYAAKAWGGLVDLQSTEFLQESKARADENLNFIRVQAHDDMQEELSKADGIPPTEYARISQMIASLANARLSDIDRIKASIQKAIADGKDFGDTDKSLNDQQNREEVLNSMLDEITRKQRDVQLAMQEAADKGYISQENMKKSDEEQEKIDDLYGQIKNMPPGAERDKRMEEWAERTIAHAQHNKEIIEDAIAKARTAGDIEMAEKLEQQLKVISDVKQKTQTFNEQHQELMAQLVETELNPSAKAISEQKISEKVLEENIADLSQKELGNLTPSTAGRVSDKSGLMV